MPAASALAAMNFDFMCNLPVSHPIPGHSTVF
jgi:hypothetical protein